MVELNVTKTKAEDKDFYVHWSPTYGYNLASTNLMNPINCSMSIAAQTRAIEDSLNAMTLSVYNGFDNMCGLHSW